LLNYWDGYKLSNKRINKFVSDIKSERRIHIFSELEFEYDEEKDPIPEEFLKGESLQRQEIKISDY
jgi:phage terminase large subunit